ncbi:MAG: hypothetical protein JW891_08365 [Candidatus Lokiarchaeota archaeon]|nr:hypothetical protein [Candidatus Lokiarchaeota archaeon]
MEKKVRGGLLKATVKAIRANKTGVYDSLINDDDKKIVRQQILESAWYPFDTYKRLLNTVAKIIANDDVKIVEKWGYSDGRKNVTRIHKGRSQKITQRLAMKAYNSLFKLWFNFGDQKADLVSENEMHLVLDGFDPDFKFFYYLAKGWMTSYFENYFNANISATFLKKSWEGADKTVIGLKWSS